MRGGRCDATPPAAGWGLGVWREMEGKGRAESRDGRTLELYRQAKEKGRKQANWSHPLIPSMRPRKWVGPTRTSCFVFPAFFFLFFKEKSCSPPPLPPCP